MSEQPKTAPKAKNDTFNKNERALDTRMTNIQAAKGFLI